MRVTSTAGALRNALVTASHATPSNPSLIAYSGVLLLVNDATASLVGSDGETTISAQLDVEEPSPGQVLVAPGPLGKYLATLDPELGVTLSAEEGGDLEVAAKGCRPYTFRPISATFPLPAAIKSAPAAVDFTRLLAALKAVRASTPKENPGVQLVSSGTSLHLYTTDSYRLSGAELPEAGFGDFAGQISLAVLERLARQQIDRVSVDPLGTRTLRFAGPEVVISTRLLATPFPSVDNVLAQMPPHSANMPTSELRRALARLAAVSGESTPLHCNIAEGSLSISVTNTDVGTGAEDVSLLAQQGGAFEFGVKLGYLSDAVAAHDTAEVSFRWTLPEQPLFVVSEDPFAVTSVVMPVRLKG